MSLNKIFKPKSAFLLFRFGKNYDGGYLVGLKTVRESKVLISCGIKNDWSFELDFIKYNRSAKILCIDNQLDLKLLLRLIFQQLIFIFWNRNFSLLLNNFKNFFSFFSFRKKVTIIKKHISYGDIINISKGYEDIFFKIDIDGSEYRIFNELIEIKNKILGLVIEIHDIDLHKDKIINFINQLGMQLVHIHPNNFAGVDENNDPIVLELTFEKKPEISNGEIIFPNKLDMKNNPLIKDIYLNFDDNLS
jgi:hypothetical protein